MTLLLPDSPAQAFEPVSVDHDETRVETARVAVIGGGANCEHEVSLASAASVADALTGTGRYDVVRLTIDPQGGWRDREGRPLGLSGAACVLRSCRAVLPIVHGPAGEDGTLAALCELAGLPYVGSPVRAGAVAMDKALTKLVAATVGVATADGVVLRRGDAVPAWRGPVVVKPVAAGSSHGVALVTSPADLPAALDAAWALDTQVLVEEVLHGREIDVAVLGRPDGSRVVAPPLEVVTDGVFGLAEKYDGTADLRVPADVGDDVRARLKVAAVAMYDALGCAGVARIDFFWVERDGVGIPVLNEVNTMPGMTEHSQVPRMFAAAGLPYPDLLDLMVRDVLG